MQPHRLQPACLLVDLIHLFIGFVVGLLWGSVKERLWSGALLSTVLTRELLYTNLYNSPGNDQTVKVDLSSDASLGRLGLLVRRPFVEWYGHDRYQQDLSNAERWAEPKHRTRICAHPRLTWHHSICLLLEQENKRGKLCFLCHSWSYKTRVSRMVAPTMPTTRALDHNTVDADFDLASITLPLCACCIPRRNPQSSRKYHLNRMAQGRRLLF